MNLTNKLLKECAKVGYDRVAIEMEHESIPYSVGHNYYFIQGNVFAHKKGAKYDDEPRISGWPAIWRILEKLKIAGACGNCHSHFADCSKLTKGLYHFIDNKWVKIK